ncbi:MAG: archaeal flagellar protein FlaJ [Thermoproteota archaeon]|nr:archaeal flagellar protein FlaJ [Thermoproteota archaeon]
MCTCSSSISGWDDRKLRITPTDLIFNKRLQYLLIGASVAIAVAIVSVGYILLTVNSIALFNFHVFVSIAIMAGLVIPAIILIFKDKRKNQIDQSLPRILEGIAEGLRAGMTLIESIEEVSKQNYGWISRELQAMVVQMSLGIPIEDAFQNFAKRIGTDMTRKMTALLTAAIRLGGDLDALFMSTSEFLHQMLEAKDERNEQLRPYLSFIYITLIVFVVTMYMLYNSLGGLFSLQSNILKIQLSQNELKILLFDLAIMEAVFGGLVASKLSSGSLYPGLKHSIIMLLLSTMAFVMLF